MAESRAKELLAAIQNVEPEPFMHIGYACEVESASTVIARLPCLSALEAIRLCNWANDYCEKTALALRCF
uniref:Uncharacterized protein n=1 Tax=Thermosporothrix sp. COM3 TaxID=2490863 RepID=A0A455SN66_9CHLR|nr:hypothetical protein KTC_45780 [Thermosporothrix sp. COM3]